MTSLQKHAGAQSGQQAAAMAVVGRGGASSSLAKPKGKPAAPGGNKPAAAPKVSCGTPAPTNTHAPHA